jgi:hypothetical protein
VIGNTGGGSLVYARKQENAFQIEKIACIKLWRI